MKFKMVWLVEFTLLAVAVLLIAGWVFPKAAHFFTTYIEAVAVTVLIIATLLAKLTGRYEATGTPVISETPHPDPVTAYRLAREDFQEYEKCRLARYRHAQGMPPGHVFLFPPSAFVISQTIGDDHIEYLRKLATLVKLRGAAVRALNHQFQQA